MEIVIAATIAGLVLTGLAAFLVDVSRINFMASERLEINQDIRSLTDRLTQDIRGATRAFVYEDFMGGSSYSFRNPDTSSGLTRKDYRLFDSESGDLLVLVYYDLDPNPQDRIPPPVAKLVGYYRQVTDPAENLGPVRRLERNFHAEEGASRMLDPDDSANDEIEDWIPSMSTVGQWPEVLELSRGMAHQSLFHHYRGEAIMINAYIFHGNAAKRVTDTYNLTVAPRGPYGNEEF